MNSFITSSVEQTHLVAKEIIKKIYNKFEIIFILLYGNLGCGKTEFVKGVAEELKISPKKIISPTFIIINELNKKKHTLYHIDLYRIEKNLATKLLRDFIEELPSDKKIILCIEWAEKLNKKILNLLNSLDKSILIKVKIIILTNNKRKICILK